VDNLKDIGFLNVCVYNGFHMAGPQKTGNISGSQEDRFLKAFDEYADALFRHALYRLSDRERAIEIVHDTFTKVWGYIRTGHEIDTYKPFLYKVLNNLIIDEYRRTSELSLDALMDEEGTDEGSFAELHGGSLEELTFALDAKKASELIQSMPHQYREVIVLRYIDGLGPKEISALVEVSENVVSVRIHRGLKYLRDSIKASEEAANAKRTKR
jgi:RNA polymerase sigma-70 factor (ECF subfamily)